MNSRRTAATPLILVLGLTCSVSAEGFYDDFSNGSVTDGDPVLWTPIEDSVLDATTGDVVVTGNVRLYENSFSGLRFRDHEFGDVSVRTQARLNQGGWIAVTVRDDAQPIYNQYIAVLTGAGQFVVGGVFAGNDYTPSGFISTDLRPRTEDVVLQLDAIGNTVSFWAWKAGDTMPAQPLFTFQDDTIQNGGIALNLGSTQDETVSGVFRYVWVDTKSIPEPASITTAMIGLIGLAALRRRNVV